MGYGDYIVEHGSHVVCGQWSLTESLKSSTWRELRAVELTLQSLLSDLSGHRVKWYTDNQNVVRTLLVGSKKAELHTGAIRIFVCISAMRLHWNHSGSQERKIL